MKKVIILFAILFVAHSISRSQGCLPEGIWFQTQAQIDSFQINYPGCTEIEGDVIINGEDIVNLTGLNVIASIGGYLQIGGQNLYYDGNPLLANLSGLDNLTSLGGFITIAGNVLLTDVSALSNLTSIGYPSGLWILQNESLNNILGLDAFCTCSSLRIIGNYYLTSLKGLGNITYVGTRIQIENNYNLIDLTGLEGLINVGEMGLSIIDNHSLISLSGLDNLLEVDGAIEIHGNISLESLAGLAGISTMSGGLEISNNSSLINLSGLENLSTIEGGLSIISNQGLYNLEGLNNLTTVEGNVLINGNNSLFSLSGMDGLTTIGGGLSVGEFTLYGGGNPSLNNIAALTNLTSINGHLYLFNNDALTSLEGLEKIHAGTIYDLGVTDNNELCYCHIQSICEYLAAPNGQVTISDNAPGCDSQQEVEEACLQTSIVDHGSTFEISIAPNPVKSYAVIRLDLRTNSSMQISIYNNTGVCLKRLLYTNQQAGRKEYQLDLSVIPSGMYFCRIQAGNEMLTKKIIKL